MSGTVTGPENQENTSATGSPSDSASSLRAAALLTLKSKRRKAAGEQSATAALPARPPPITDSFQLDYGQEDVVSSAASAPTPGSSKPHPVDMEDGQIREEGEISDSEEQLATAAPLTKPSPLPLKAAQSQPPQLEPAHEIKPSLASPSRMAIAKQESPPILLESITDISSSPLEIGDSPNMAVDVDESYSNNVYLAVGPDHVRPGLQMNQIQYDTAKDVILDLLGWGIPPTYLVDCGLSREIVYYVFNEFNLRLPDNFDTAGLIPYLPPPFYHSDAAQEASSSMPPPPVPSVLHYHNLPPRPLKLSDVQSPSPSSALPSSLATSSPSVSEPSPLTSLHDMERQRRQELLARKAVQASRKAKLPPPPSPNSSIASSRYVSPEHPPQDMDMATETVDDFLKTLEPTAEGEAMDVDEIPGLGRSHPVSQSPSISHQQSFMVGRVVLPLSSLPSMNAEQSSSSNSSTPTPTPLQKSASMISLDGQPVRRRPVAADFVDMDGSSRNGNGLANGRSHPPHNLRRKMGTGFANVSKMRRLVIDLSDSEGEGDEDYVMHEAGEYSSSTSSYPTTIFGTKASRGPRTQSPATLMEKEMEIARMRQLIADKEQNRVKKLMRTSSMQEPANGVSEKPVPVKQEEVDPNLDIPINGSAGERIPTTNLPRIQVAAATAAIASTSAMPLHGVNSTPNGHANAEPADEGVVQEQPQVSIMNGVDLTHGGDRVDILTEAVDVDVATSSSTQVALSMNIQRQEENLDLLEQHRGEADQFTAYASLFSSYPLLRSWLTVNGSAVRTSEQVPSPKARSTTRALSSITSTSFSSMTSFSSFSTMPRSPSSSASSVRSDMHFHGLLPAPDLRLLKTATASKQLDPSKRICEYEIPGGGICRDVGCEDVHPSRLNNQQSLTGDGAEPSDEDTAAYMCAVVVLPLGVDASKIVGILEKLRLEHPAMVFDERVSRTLEILSTQPP